MLRAYLRDVVNKLTVLPYDAAAADWQARERVRPEQSDRTLPYADGQIAAVAVVWGLMLVTANARDSPARNTPDSRQIVSMLTICLRSGLLSG